MPLYEIKTTLFNGKIEKEEIQFLNRDEAFEYVLDKFKGEWKQSFNDITRTKFINETIPVNIEIIDIVQNDIATEERTQEHNETLKQWSNTSVKKLKKYRR